jgi:glycosyltransferase involved in cell wall biosynthesis
MSQINTKKLLLIILKWQHTRLFWIIYLISHSLLNLRNKKIINSETDILHFKKKFQQNFPYPNQKKNIIILFTIHWYELGGAESFALQTIEYAKRAGFIVHVISTVKSNNPDFDKFLATADRAIIFDSSITITQLVDYIIKEGVDILHIHHSEIAYHSLPIIKALKPELEVIDSLHIVEYGTGGFPALSARYDEFIKIHNIISVYLYRYLKYVCKKKYKNNFNLNKVSLTYLIPENCTYDKKHTHPNNKEGITKLLFYGRLENQKQPYFFLKLIELLNSPKIKNKTGLIFKGIIVGDGRQLAETLSYGSHLIKKGCLEYLGRIDDKNLVFDLTDILVITSRNEGITLTSYEAICRGIPVISSDVGAQKELLPEDMLVDIWQIDPFTAFADKIIDMASNQEIAYQAMQKAQNNLMALSDSRASYNSIVSMYYDLL